ncbi:MAG: hypothetical protein CMF52_02910 [Legionellales bacterium]|nr:hypothetical protein [Legionellales bacterium]
MADTIVSGADSKYFPLLLGLINSIRDQHSLNHFDICIIDAGLSPENKRQLDKLGVRHIDVSLIKNIDVNTIRIKKNHHGYMSVVRPHLGDICKEYENVIYLDADTWVQTDQAFNYLITAANNHKLGIVSQASRLHRTMITLKTNPFLHMIGLATPRGILYKNARRARLPYHMCKNLLGRAVLNSGVFSLKTNAEHWHHWKYWQKKCIEYGRFFTSDQLSLAIAVDSEGLSVELLPDICNYMPQHGRYRYDRKLQQFTDKYIPYTPISIMHMAGVKGKLDPHKRVDCGDENDKFLEVELNHKSLYKEE